jgi:protein-S-isoprenylcysteine O-methyltransferase Ste14
MRAQTVAIIVGWAAWLGVIAWHGTRQPKRRAVISLRKATVAGFGLQAAASLLPWFWRRPSGAVRDAAAMLLAAAAVAFGCWAVRALGKQWRVPAALIADHELIRRGPYSMVRHPVYLSFLAMTVAGALVATGWPGIVVSAAVFIAGTEIRVRAEDRLLAGRFGAEFEAYRRRVPAYLPLVR